LRWFHPIVRIESAARPQDGRRLRRYERRWLVERFFAWIQWQRRLLVRWEYYAENFLGFVQLASCSGNFEISSTLTGEVLGTCAKRHRHQEWLAFLRQIDQSTPADKEIHIICDNYATHKHPKVKSWLKYRHKRCRVHFTPTSASWLNMVERFFRELSEERLKRGVFSSLKELEESVMTFIEAHNEAPVPYIWTKSANDILEKVKRGKEKLNMLQTA